MADLVLKDKYDEQTTYTGVSKIIVPTTRSSEPQTMYALNNQMNVTATPSTVGQMITYDPNTYTGLDHVYVNPMDRGTVYTPTAAKGTVSNHTVSVTPSVSISAGYVDTQTKAGTPVTVSISELVSNSDIINIHSNDDYDVTEYKTAHVSIPFTSYQLTASAGVFTSDILKDSLLPQAFFAVDTPGTTPVVSTSALYVDASAIGMGTGFINCVGVDFDTNTVRFHGKFTVSGTTTDATAEADYDQSAGTLEVTSVVSDGQDASAYISMVDFTLFLIGVATFTTE